MIKAAMSCLEVGGATSGIDSDRLREQDSRVVVEAAAGQDELLISRSERDLRRVDCQGQAVATHRPNVRVTT